MRMVLHGVHATDCRAEDPVAGAVDRTPLPACLPAWPARCVCVACRRHKALQHSALLAHPSATDTPLLLALP